jgi:DNA replication and repair protein RecF
MLTDLQMRNFRCLESLALQLESDFNFFVGANGQGKTSILEAACVLLRLQSQRSSSLAPLIRLGEKSLLVAGHYDDHVLRFRYSGLRRKVEFDEIEQRTLAEYLRLARVVSLANADIELVRGSSEARRRYLDFVGTQIDPLYRPALRGYERALRSRNALLKSPQPRPREITAYDAPLLAHGTSLMSMRAAFVERLAPVAAQAHREISGGSDEVLHIRFVPGSADDFADELERTREQEMRLRQTVVGPHRDEIELSVQGMPTIRYASEGQQRTVALALKLAQARLFAEEPGASPPLLLIDDIFGELDPGRRNALLAHLPNESQKFVTATTLSWRSGDVAGPIWELRDGQARRQNS